MSETQSVLSTLSYVRKFAGETILIKLGGAALEDPALVESICQDLTLIRSAGISLVLVHGGGPSINQELTGRGISWEFIDGQRVTTPDMMDVIEMVLCGSVNRRIVRGLNRFGVRAIGLSGVDGATLRCKKADGRLQQVGVIDEVDTSYLRAILATRNERGECGIPVVAPIGIGRNGEAYNINADWAASRIAQAMGIRKVLFLTDQDGILDLSGDLSGNSSGGSAGKLIPELDAGELEGLIEAGAVTGGMLAKARTILHALRNGVSDVHVLNARRPHGLIEELFTNRGIGTICKVRSRQKEPHA
ncbi:MAG: acetylglutamate kinase [Oligoflexia bacterium]|nr:acetylglutamate kinase [Oligoflexia bacterium]